MNNKIIKFQEAGKLPTAATYTLWLKGTLSYLTGIKDSDLVESKYIPSKATNKNTKYYTRKGLDYDVMRNLLGGKESKAKKFDGTPLYYKNFNDLYTRLSNLNGKQLRTTDNSHLGEYTIGIGQDKNGRYVSYYDKFDWAPKENLEIFSPYEIYNRIYEKDFDRMLKELDNEEYSGSNPSGKWFFKSGINNKGYLKKGGLIELDNVRKLKYKDGGFFLSLKVNKHLAFVPGATITDSNPRAYSQIKKHKGDTEWIDKSSKGLKVKSNLNPKYYLKRKVEKASKGTAFGLTISNALGKVGNFFKNNELGLSILSTGINLGLNSLTNSANKNVISNEAEISKANAEKNAANEKLNNSARAEEMVRNTLALLYDKDNPNAFGGDIVKGQLKLEFLNLLNIPIDQELATLKALIDFLANQLKNLYSMDYLGGLSTDILNAFSNNKKSSSNNPPSDSYFGNYVNTLYKNYGTYNSDGSMNLGNRLGTFSITGGYKPRQYQMKTYTPLLKFSL